jgi:hypothetical protein
MDNIKIWFNQAKSIATTFKTYDSDFIIYKGFKLSKRNNEYYLQDVRFSNLYTEVSKENLDKFLKLGFKKGADLISFERDSMRVISYKKRTEALYDKRKLFEKELPKKRAFNEKRIRNINKRIDEFIDLLFFYEVRVKQFNIKNN